jgi:hypothetical protein
MPPSPEFHEKVALAIEKRVLSDKFRIMSALLPGVDSQAIDLHKDLKAHLLSAQDLSDKDTYHTLICGVMGVPVGRRPDGRRPYTEREAILFRALNLKNRLLESRLITQRVAEEFEYEKLVEHTKYED